MTATEVPEAGSAGTGNVNEDDLLLVTQAFGLDAIRDVTTLSRG